MSIQHVRPEEIERRSMEIIQAELGDRAIEAEYRDVVLRVIHTTADFDYAENLVFSEDAAAKGREAILNGASIVTDTRMAWAGINKAALEKAGARALCFMGDEDVAQAAREQGTTRAWACMDKAATLEGDVIIAVGNAPTALIRLRELIDEGEIQPRLVIGVPVGFVNVVESKELIMEAGVPYIVAKGRKGGSNVAAAIVNALAYRATGRQL